ncbi:TolC family outer membrane protein [Flavisphingomonas formosensis]|uniref:TolC family outer membrane protein n=1 Tax=Flavisphingomonas formosensis TaxID=861534 RepID=UPI0012F8FA6E|nr:TolC family outer membrane protein [Sphingomonas formosensis]
MGAPRSVRRLWLGGLVSVALAGGGAEAASLREALISAYNSNPEMTGARAAQDARDADVGIAKAGARPNVGATADYTENLRRSGLNLTSPNRQLTAGINASIPIYQGGAVSNGIKAAKLRNTAGLSTLRSSEADVFTQVVAAYMDVIRDTAIVELNQKNVSVLDTNLRATNDRFEVGDVTKTDVAQSEARLAGARSQLDAAEATLTASRETYLRVIGLVADMLDPPPPLPNLPQDTQDAVEVAVANNPDLLAARKNAEAFGYDIKVAKAARMPRLSAVGGANYLNYFNSLPASSSLGGESIGTFTQHGATTSAGLSLTIPLYQGGLPSAQVRRAEAEARQALEQVVAVERNVVAQARSTFANYQAALAVIKSSETAVSANELALEGTRAENTVGTRNVLDVLNAEQELLNSRVQLVSARRDAYVAGFALLAAMGRAGAADLGLDGGTLYDPSIHYRKAANDWSDWHGDGPPRAVATPTYGPTEK